MDVYGARIVPIKHEAVVKCATFCFTWAWQAEEERSWCGYRSVVTRVYIGREVVKLLVHGDRRCRVSVHQRAGLQGPRQACGLGWCGMERGDCPGVAETGQAVVTSCRGGTRLEFVCVDRQ